MRHRLTFEQWIPFPVAQVFAFFANPDNLPPLMPSWQKARIDTASILPPAAPPRHHASTQAAGVGSRMLISFRPVPFAPVRMQWDARIAEFAWDHHFCDEQLSGPFAYWRHCHRLRVEDRGGESGTVVTDDVTYEMKFGPLGEIGNMLGGSLQMQSLFHYRQRQLVKLLTAAT